MTTSRRNFLVGVASFVAAAPAIVKSASLMPVKAIVSFEELPSEYQYIHQQIALGYSITRKAIEEALYSAYFPADANFTKTTEVNWALIL